MIKKRALKYLGYKYDDKQMSALMDALLEELEEYASFKAYYREFEYVNNTIQELDLHIDSKDLEVYFDGCDKVIVIAATLGITLEKHLRLLQKTDLSKCVVMDALASSYLEYKLDEYESFIKEERTYRFAPGYGDLDLNLNRLFFNALNLDKRLGISLTESGLFLPQKTMLGLIGIGHANLKKSCHTCIKYNDCSLRKEQNQCWKD